MHLFRKSLAALLVLTTVAQTAIPVFSAATYAKDTGTFVLTDSEGNQTIVDESWEEAYPTGTFAFSADQINLYEGATDGTETGSITLYRLGGTEGRAEAYVTLSPMVTQLDENTKGYAYAAGTKDYTVTVENPQPIAFYQPLGTPAGVVRSSSYAIAENTKLAKEDGSYPYYIMDLDEADVEGYQWQVLSGENWLDVDGATDALFYVTDDYYWSYDGVRCIFMVDGVSYCTIDDSGNVYEDGIEDELLEPMPEDFVNSTDKTYYEVEFDGNEYDMYTIAVIFAEGEWQKEITFTALDDDLHENTEVVALQITEARGAMLYDSAMTATVAIADDEAELPSQIGFATDVVYANKADGSVQIPLVREDGTQYIVGAVYQIADGTAVLGTDYAAVEGDNVTYFPADMTTSALEVTLIDDGVALEKDETGVYFTVTLTEVQGATGSGIMAGKETCKVYLYNTSTEKPENGNIATELYSSEETDAGAGVLTTPALATMQDTIVAEAEEVPVNLVGSYEALLSTDLINGRAYNYGTLKFDGAATDSNYWKLYSMIANTGKTEHYDEDDKKAATAFQNDISGNNDSYDGYMTDASLWEFDPEEDNNRGNGWEYSSQKEGSMNLDLAGIMKTKYVSYTLNDIYEKMYLIAEIKADKNWWGVKGAEVKVNFRGSGKHTTAMSSGKWDVNEYTIDDLSDVEKINFWTEHSGSLDAESWVHLDYGYLQRRTMSAPIVVLHTADDDLIKAENDDVKDYIIDIIEPEIALVAGKGGVTSNGDFYVGSQITVSRGNNASTYQFATAENSSDPTAGVSVNLNAVNFSQRKSNVEEDPSVIFTVAAPKSVTGSATLTLAKSANNTQNNQINIYMDRVQDIVLDITPSVERTQEGASTIKTDDISLANAWKLVTDQTNNVSYKHKVAETDTHEGMNGMKYGAVQTDTLALSSFTQTIKSTSAVQYKKENVKNVRTINFGLSEKDCIVFNGKTYAGNADIDIPVSLYTSDSLVFYYYNEDYLAVDNTMVATITKIERYIDVNDNNMVDDKDIVMPSITEDSYSITELSPVKTSDGKYHQIVLRTFYSLLPRNLFAPDEASEKAQAEVLPALVTMLTNTGGLSTEQQGYRYLAHENAGTDTKGTGYVPMYGASGTVERYIDVALGGDYSPATYDGTTFTWNPDWKGNSYFTGGQFEDPDPIYLDGTAVGDRYPVGEVDTSGTLTSAGKTAVQNYLVGIHANDTISLCVRDTNADKTRSTSKQVTGLESVTLAPFKTHPDATSARNLTDPNADQNKNADFDSSAADSPMPEYNMSGEQTMPNLDISLGDYVTIATEGQEISFTIGVPLLSYENATSGQDKDYGGAMWEDPEVNSIKDTTEGAIEAVKSVFNSLRGKDSGGSGDSSSPSEMVKDSMDSYMRKLRREQRDAKSAGNYGIKIKGVEGSLALSISIVVKWDPVDTSFHFNQMLIVLTGSIQFSYTAYLTPCPIFYVSVTIAFEAEMSLGLEAVRKKVIAEEFKSDSESVATITGGKNSKLVFSSGDWTYEKSDKLGSENANDTEDGDVFVGAPGATFTVTTTKKAIDVHFNGTLYVDAVDASGKAPEGFTAGTITSAGQEDGSATIKLAKSVDGKDNDQKYTVTFTVVDDGKTRLLQVKDEVDKLGSGYAMIDRVITVSKNTTDVMFAGVSISPSLFMELAIGVGVELFKIELFANISVSCAFAIAATEAGEYDGDKNETQAFSFNEFSLAAALGFRVTALFFDFEFEAVKFMITYDKEAKFDQQTGEKSGWKFVWYAAGKEMKGRTASLDEDSPLTIRVILPGEGDNENVLYTPEDNLATDKERAYTPTDETVPFEYTAAFDSGDAFTLGDGFASGTNYKLITVGSDNYLVYTTKIGTSIDESQLVISKVQETVDGDNSGFGLVSPVDATKTYYKLDDDDYGDLDFDAWVVDDDTIRVAWVSYMDGAKTAYDEKVTAKDEIGAMAEAGKYTQVKSVTLTVGDTVAAGNVEIVSDNADGHGLYYMVSGAGELVFYNEANYYDDSELETYLTDSRTYLGGSADYETTGGYKYGTSDPTADFQMYYRELNARLYGKTGYPTYALRNEDGTYSITSRKSTEWEDNHVQMENAALTKIGDDYYAAYSTAYSKIDDADELTYRKLYLQKLVVEKTTVTDTTTGEGGTTETPTTTVQTLNVGDPVAVRSLVDSDKDSTKDGIYKDKELSVAYEDPYFANLNFLTGKLGALTGESEDFDEILALDSRTRDGEAAEASTFLLFEMNGETLVVPEASLTSITDTTADKRSGMIVPFFEKETADELNKANADENVYNVESAPVLGNVTFGVDGEGNITAVYTRSVRGTSSNGLYMAKYDAKNQTWGNGVMLAMRDMTTYENSIREDWDEETTKEAFYGGTNPAVFNFGKISVGLAAADGEEDRLLVITEGTLTALTTTTAMVPTYDANGNVSGMVAVEDEVVYEMATTTDGTYDTTNGIYALTFGAGKQALGLTSISLSNYDFTPGSTLQGSVAFTNVGDTTLRGSVNEPLQIELKMAYGSTVETLATWTVKSSVASGQEVETELTQIPLPAAGTDGKNPFADAYIYFTVSESSTSETNFTADTKAYDDNDKIVADAACIVLGDKAEVALEKCDIAVVDANDTTVTLSVDAYVTNRGSTTATGNTLSFSYSKTGKDGSATEASLEGTAILKMGEVEALNKSKSSGISVNLDNLPSMTGQSVTGTITVSKDVFDTAYGEGSLNLVVSVEGNVAEHNLMNNTVEVAVEPTTLITAPAKISMQVGSTMRIPVTLRTTTETDPVITVTELPVEGQEDCMSVLYYNSDKGALVVMPGREGEGTIRIADTATNSILDICYSVKGEGEFINIYNDNGIFTWYVSDENGFLTLDDEKDPKWEFADNLYKFPGTLSGMPYRNDLANAKVGYAFSFQTFATKLDLYFMGETDNKALEGKVTVSSDLEGFSDVTLSSNDATKAQTVNFDNTYNNAHTVTITAMGGKLVRFDKLLEYFNENMTIYSGKTAPLFTFSRDLPETASVKAGTEVPLAIYFIDNHGLTDAMLDGKSVLGDTNLTQISDSLWKYDLTNVWTENGSHTIFIQNDSGMTTTRTITVEWFSGIDVDEEKKDALPGEIRATLVDADDKPVLKAGAEDIYVKLTDKDGNPIVDSTGDNIVISHLEYLYDEKNDPAHENPESQYMQTYKPTDVTKASDGMYKLPATGNTSAPQEGVYRVTYTDPETGITSTVLVQLGAGETSSPKATIKVDEDGYILITASKTLQGSGDGKLDSATVNGAVVATGINDTTFSKKLDTPVAYNGVYTVTVTDQNGNSMTASTTVTQYPMVVPEEVLDAEPAKDYTDGVLNENGTVTVTLSGITGGQYDKERSSGYTNLVPKYQVAIVNSLDELEGTAVLDWKTVEETADSYVFSGLAVGTYTVYIRDANAPDTVIEREAVIKQYNVEVTGVQFTPSRDSEGGSITITAIGGMGDREYRLVDENGDPFLDKDGKELYGWQKDNTFTDLPDGEYYVQVRDTENPEDNVVTYPDPDKGEGGITVDKLYSVKVITDEGGHVEINGVTVENGGMYYYLLGTRLVIESIPDKSNRTATLRINGEEVELTSEYFHEDETTAVIESIDQSYVIEAYFGMDYSGIMQALTYYESTGKYKVKHTITATVAGTATDEGGSISPEGKTIVYYGDKLTYTITPDSGYEIAMILVDGKRVDVADTYTFTETSRDRTIAVTFRAVETVAEKTGTAETAFTDVASSDWYAADVAYVYDAELMIGTDEAHFSPSVAVNRAMLVTILWRMEGEVTANVHDTFTDVPVGQWYSEAVAWAAEKGLVNGYGDGTFGPMDALTREQILVILNRYAALKGIATETGTEAVDFVYSDWASSAVAWAQDKELLTGFGWDISDLTIAAGRAELAAFLRRYLQ